MHPLLNERLNHPRARPMNAPAAPPAGSSSLPSVLTQVVLFTSSFSPLLVTMGIMNTFGSGLPSVLCYAASAGSVIALAVLIRLTRHLNPLPVTIARARHRDGDAIGYVVTYLLPFLGLQSESAGTRLAILILFLVLFVLYVKAQLFYVNPVLAFRGFHILECETPGGNLMILVTKRDFVHPNSSLTVRKLADRIMMEV